MRCPPSSCSHALRRPVRINNSEGAEKARVFGHVAENPSVFCHFGVVNSDRAPKGWSVRFCGLAAPGGPALTSSDDLVAIWKSSDGRRFQNYKASFTVLDVLR